MNRVTPTWMKVAPPKSHPCTIRRPIRAFCPLTTAISWSSRPQTRLLWAKYRT